MRKRTGKLYSVFSGLITQYIEYKKNIGCKTTVMECLLKRFDKFANDRNEKVLGISKDLADAWCCKFPGESEDNRYYRIIILRGFSSFLQTIGYDSYIPILPKHQSNFVPYIYTPDEMERIFKECDRINAYHHVINSARFSIPCLIRLLYGTGIRIGEAIKLKHCDIDFKNECLLLRECKKGKDRYVPLSPSLALICRDYVTKKQKFGLSINPENYFFVKCNDTSISSKTISNIFNHILERAGIVRNENRKGPRLHDLRHTFCVNSFVQLCESGKDIHNVMLILMTYMGHQSIAATNKYVRIVETMFPEIVRQVDMAHNHIFPNMDEMTD